MTEEALLNNLRRLLIEHSDRAARAKHIAEAIAAARNYRWVGVYEVTANEIGMLGCTGATPPAFPRFPRTKGLCGSAVASNAIVNVGNVQEDPRWLTTFGSTRSEIIVPVLEDGAKTIGLIDVESDVLNAFSKDDERFLSDCAPILLPLFR
jgi:L-methionine (R)-S-oxide reductase